MKSFIVQNLTEVTTTTDALLFGYVFHCNINYFVLHFEPILFVIPDTPNVSVYFK